MGRTAAGRRGFGFGYAPLMGPVTLLSAPNGYGGYVAPRAAQYGNRVFFGYTDGSGNVEMAHYDEIAKTTSTPVKVNPGTWSADVHNGPSVLVRNSDKRILSAFAQHNGSNCYIAVSTNPGDASAFGTATDISGSLGGTQDFTYMSLAQLTGVASEPIYVVYREHTTLGYIAYGKSTDDGATWGTRVRLVQSPSGQDVYFQIAQSATRIHIFTTDTDRSTPAALYHCYLQGDQLYKSDGTLLSSLPVSPSSATQVKSNADGGIHVTGATVEADGTPAVIFFVYKSGTTTNEVWVGRYRSGSWQCDKVADTNGLLSSFKFESAASLLNGSADVAYLSRNVSSTFEMFRYTTDDDGSTWTGVQFTSGSSGHAALSGSVNDSAGIKAIWSRGTISSSSSFNMGIEGLRG